MKRSFVLALGLLFLAGTGMALATDSASPKLTNKVVKHPRHHKGPKKPKVTLNPQPLPPAKHPVDAASSGGDRPQESNKAQ